MTIARRVMILVAVPLIALLGLGYFGRAQLSQLREQTRFATETQVRSLAALGRISRTLTEMRVSARAHLLSVDQAARDAARAGFHTHKLELNRLLDRYADTTITDAKDQRLLAEYAALTEQWIQGAEQAMSLASEGRRDDAERLLSGSVAATAQRLTAASDDWIGHHERITADASEATLRAIDDARLKIILVAAVAVGLSAWLGLATFRRIVRPLRSVEAAVNAAAAGELSREIPGTAGTDEIASLARAIDVLKHGAAETDEQRWVKSTGAQVMRELQGATTLQEFGDRFLSSVVTALGGGVAALYVEDDAGDGGVRQVAAYGLADLSAANQAFAPGQGLVGECLRQRAEVRLFQVPPDYLRVTSGLGAAPPTDVRAMPLLWKESLLGVTELALFRPPARRESALLNELLPVAAMTLEVLRRNLRTAELLGQTREQARQLEAQTAELTASQAELLAQQEELLAQRAELTAQKEQLRDTEQFYRGVLELAPDGLMVVDEDGTIRLANAQCETLFGYARVELIGRSVESLVPPDVRPRHAGLRQSFHRSAGARGMGAGLSLSAARKDGSLVPVEIGLSPLPVPDGQPAQVALSIRDVTERKRAEAELRKRSEELQQINFLSDGALDLTKAGYWHVPLDNSGWYNSSERAARIFGDPPTPDHRYSLEHWMQHVRAGDEAAAKATFENFSAAVEGVIPVYDATYAYKRPVDGEVVWIHALGHVVKDAAGKPTDMFGVTQDITDFKRLEAELREAMRQAGEATKAKSAFLANMSHEIRTPMNGVIGMTELALDTDLTAEQRDYLNTVKWSADALLSLINDILDFSKIEAGKIELDPVEFLLRDAISDTLNPLALRASSKGVELAYDVASEVPDAVIADVYRLRQILVNLVGNAIKFTESGEVVVSVRLAEPADGQDLRLAFEVRDTGIGIPPAAAAKLFKPFEQADAATTRKFGGTGLGLAISKQLVELMGGEIRLQSEPGKGSTFSFTARAKVGSPRHAADAGEAAKLLRGKTALVVDDNETNRRILETMLSHWGLRTLSADSASNALALLDRSTNAGQAVSLLISDLHMPEADGFDLIASLRRQSAFEFLPVILLSSSASQGDQKRCDELRVAARLLKPAKQSLLLDNIMRVMEVHTKESTPSPATPSNAAQEHSTVDVTQTARAGGDDGGPATPGALRVLLAEDNAVNVKFASKLLEKAGHHVTVAGNGREAVSAWSGGEFDLLLMDVQMPEMDGLEATRAIRSAERERGGGNGTARRTPIIAMTANAMAGDREMCIAAGMNGYVAKPVKRDALLSEMERVLTQGGGHAAHV